MKPPPPSFTSFSSFLQSQSPLLLYIIYLLFLSGRSGSSWENLHMARRLEGKQLIDVVIINGGTLDWCNVFSGAPQGSVLGPVCLVTYAPTTIEKYNVSHTSIV